MAKRENKQLDAYFVNGSITRHILVMSSTSALGLMAIFLVDLTDMYFLSLLGEQAIAAAIGFAGSIAFFTTSICIALSIAAGVKISREVGAGDSQKARSTASNIAVLAILVSLAIIALVWPNIDNLLGLLGATGLTRVYAREYLQILLPSMPVLALGMAAAGALRALGDAKRAMMCTLVGSFINLLLDPVFIFVLDMGVKGAALASVFARASLLLVAAFALVRIHGLIAKFSWLIFKNDFSQLLAIGVPALLTNMATPVGAAFVTRMVSNYGDSYVAGFAVIGRVIPVAFALIFALSGAIGSIIGQNYGAGNFDRVKHAQIRAVLFGSAYTLFACFLVWLAIPLILRIFNLNTDASALFVFYWTFVSWAYVFLGAQFVSNASFNNLRKPQWSTMSNWGRILFGTIPLTWLGAKLYGVYGVLVGEALGMVLTGTIVFIVSRRLVNHLQVDKLSDYEIIATNSTAASAAHSSGTAVAAIISCRIPSPYSPKPDK